MNVATFGYLGTWVLKRVVGSLEFISFIAAGAFAELYETVEEVNYELERSQQTVSILISLTSFFVFSFLLLYE